MELQHDIQLELNSYDALYSDDKRISNDYSTGEPLVSVISPCYNGEKYLREYFDSLLNQNYNNIEFFFVNDGSDDSTEDIAVEYEAKFAERGIRYHHMYVTNRGQAAAINVALPLIQGKYLIWPDSDDVLLKDNLSLKVTFLEENSDIDLVITQAQCVDEDMKPIEGKINRREHKDSDASVFLDYIDERDVVFQPGVFMARVDTVRKVIPEMKIYEGQGGQNWQFILPIAYKGKCGYIDQVTYLYRIYNQSHSHYIKSSEEILKRMNEHELILTNVVSQVCGLGTEQCELLLKRIKIKYLRRKANIYILNHDKKAAVYYIKQLISYNELRISDIILALKTICPTVLKRSLKIIFNLGGK